MAEPPRLLHQLFDVLGTGMAVLDRELRYLYVNPALAKLNGRPVGEHIGRSVHEVIPGYAHMAERLASQVVATREPVVDEEMTFGEGDSARSYSVSYMPMIEDGEIVAIGVSVADVTARRKAVDRLKSNEAHFRAICETAPVGIFMTDAKGNSLYSNPTNLAQMGTSQEATRGHGWQKAIHPEDLPRVAAAFFEATRTGGVYSGVNRYLHEDGKVVWVDVTARAIRDGDAIVGFLGITQDVTERTKIEAALKQRDLELQQLAENIGSVFWLSTADNGRPLYVSPAFEKVWGRPVDIVQSRDEFLATIHPDDRQLMDTVFRRSTDGPREIEYRVIRPDGSIVWVNDRLFPVRDENGTCVRIAGLATDVTARKALETQAREAHKLDSIGRLAGGVAHDFNNLLTVILSQVTLARRAIDAGRNAAEELGQIEEAAVHAADLTRRLLMFARRGPTQLALVDPGELLRGVEQLLRRVIGEDVRLVTSIAPELGVVRADRTQLEQVLVNLAINARDAMPKGGSIVIETANVDAAPDGRPGEPHVVFRVRDEGRGIPEEHRAHLFEPFFTTKPPGEGTGLGLATCYGIVMQLGGRIEVESSLGRGSTFSVYLPRIDAPADARSRPVLAAEVLGSETVLLVEDDARVRDVAVRALRDHGFDVVAAANGAEAMRIVENGRPQVDIVVTDMVMPVLGGRDLATKLRDDHPSMRVLFTSGYAASGADESTPFLAKPYVPNLLVRRVRDVLDGRG